MSNQTMWPESLVVKLVRHFYGKAQNEASVIADFKNRHSIYFQLQKDSNMTANNYQMNAARTLIDIPDFTITNAQIMLSWNAIGLAGEAGEVLDLIKKGIYHQQGLDKDKLKKELGDVLWYVSALATELDFTLEEIMQANIDKLKARYPEGYDPGRSTYKKDFAE